MKIRLSLRDVHRAVATKLSVALSMLCVLLLAGCVAPPGNANTYTSSVSAVDESGAAQTLKVIAGAQAMYSVSNGGEYGSFEQLSSGGMLDKRFAKSPPEMNGYVYTMKLTAASGATPPAYAVNADPKTPASGIQTAGRHLYLDSTSGVIHSNNTQPATANDPAFP